MWDPEPFIDILERLAPVAVRESDPVGLRTFLHDETLDYNCRRPMLMVQAGPLLREFRMGFVYDRQAGFVVGCGFGEHERVAAALSRVRQFGCPVDWDRESDLQDSVREADVDRFLNEGWGFIVNSPRLSAKDASLSHAWPLRLGADVPLTAQEKLWFRGFELIRQD